MNQRKEGVISRISSAKLYFAAGCFWILISLLIAIGSRNKLHLITYSSTNFFAFIFVLCLLVVGILYLLMGVGKIKTNNLSDWSLIVMLSPILVMLVTIAFLLIISPVVGEIGLGIVFGATYVCGVLILIAFVLLIISLLVRR